MEEAWSKLDGRLSTAQAWARINLIGETINTRWHWQPPSLVLFLSFPCALHLTVTGAYEAEHQQRFANHDLQERGLVPSPGLLIQRSTFHIMPCKQYGKRPIQVHQFVCPQAMTFNLCGFV